ncbi:MAG: hypothetical protein HRT90_00725 [Candidatus Margulisbacteria bacterium]|nr:hypothetical protein [Candidatus Margulisiibacteriota bacterium]
MQGVQRTQYSSQPVRGGMMQPRATTAGSRPSQALMDLKNEVSTTGDIQKQFSFIKGRIKNQLDNFEEKQNLSDLRLTQTLQEYQRNPKAFKEKYDLSKGANVPDFIVSLVKAPVELAYTTTKQQFELIGRAIDLISQNEEAFTSVMVSKFTAYAKGRLEELDILDKQLDIEDKVVQNQIKEKSALLSLQIEEENHELAKIESAFRRDLDAENATHTRDLQDRQHNLNAEIQRSEQVLKREGLASEQRLKIETLKQEKELELKKIDASIVIAKDKSKAAIAIGKDKADADKEAAKAVAKKNEGGFFSRLFGTIF